MGPKVIDVGCWGSTGGPVNPSKRSGASPPTFQKGVPAPRGLTDPPKPTIFALNLPSHLPLPQKSGPSGESQCPHVPGAEPTIRKTPGRPGWGPGDPFKMGGLEPHPLKGSRKPPLQAGPTRPSWGTWGTPGGGSIGAALGQTRQPHPSNPEQPQPTTRSRCFTQTPVPPRGP